MEEESFRAVVVSGVGVGVGTSGLRIRAGNSITVLSSCCLVVVVAAAAAVAICRRMFRGKLRATQD